MGLPRRQCAERLVSAHSTRGNCISRSSFTVNPLVRRRLAPVPIAIASMTRPGITTRDSPEIVSFRVHNRVDRGYTGPERCDKLQLGHRRLIDRGGAKVTNTVARRVMIAIVADLKIPMPGSCGVPAAPEAGGGLAAPSSRPPTGTPVPPQAISIPQPIEAITPQAPPGPALPLPPVWTEFQALTDLAAPFNGNMAAPPQRLDLTGLLVPFPKVGVCRRLVPIALLLHAGEPMGCHS